MIGIDSLDSKILKIIGTEPMYPSEISRRLGVLRTTIQYRLGRLSDSGLVKKNIEGRKSIWQPVYKNDHNKNHYRVYKDKEIVQAYNQLLNLPKQTTILSIQGSDAAKSEFDNLPTLFIKEAHRVFKRRGIVMKGISNKKALGHFDKLNKDMIKSHIGRSQGLKIFSNDSFIAPGEIMSTENFLLLANPRAKFALVIKDKGVTKIVNDTLRLVFDLLDGEKFFDLNGWLRGR
jgi:DNA-binding transcriptional ArsR family regulator